MFCFQIAIFVILYNQGFIFCFPLSQFYPFGSAAGDSSLSANDDGSTSSIPVSVNFPFFGSSYNSIFVSVNMNIFMLLDMTFCTRYNFTCMYNLCIKYFFNVYRKTFSVILKFNYKFIMRYFIWKGLSINIIFNTYYNNAHCFF